MNDWVMRLNAPEFNLGHGKSSVLSYVKFDDIFLVFVLLREQESFVKVSDSNQENAKRAPTLLLLSRLP